MLTEHETRREDDVRRESAPEREHETQLKFPDLDEPAWLEDDQEEMDEPADSPLRGIWVGIAAAAVTFVLVFAIPQWLGWYDVAPPAQRAKREATPESVIAGVTAKPSGSVETAPPAAVPSPAAPAPALPAVSLPKAGPAPAVTAPAATAAATTPPAEKVSAATPKAAKPAPPAAASASKRTFTIQIAAFKDARQAGRLAARVKGDGYPADVRRIESNTVPWVVRVGSYATREQAESARDALAKKGFRGFIL